jgi:TRAP-type mannitol/chloroaromatic compound transport system permease small subunit
MNPALAQLERLARYLSAISEWIGRGISWLTLFMVLTTFGIVVLRYGFGIGSIAAQEAVIYMHALVFLLGAAYTLKHDGHVRVDIFYRDMSKRRRAWVDLLGTVFLLIPVCVFILWTSWEYVAASWALREGSRETSGLPGVYLLKTAIPLMAVLLLLQGLALGARALLVLAGGHPPAETPAAREL